MIFLHSSAIACVVVQITTPAALVSRLIAKKMFIQITFKTNEYGKYAGPALASAGPDLKHFCGAPLNGV